MIELIVDVFTSIGKAQLIVIGIVSVSYLIEKITGFGLFVDHFTWKKSVSNTRVLKTGDTFYYIVICTGVFIYDLYNRNIDLQSIDIFGIGTRAFTNGCVIFILWGYSMRWLVTGFRWFYDKYQGVDSNKSDDDLT